MARSWCRRSGVYHCLLAKVSLSTEAWHVFRSCFLVSRTFINEMGPAIQQFIGCSQTNHADLYCYHRMSIFCLSLLLDTTIDSGLLKGWVVLSGRTHIKDSQVAFRDAFRGP